MLSQCHRRIDREEKRRARKRKKMRKIEKEKRREERQRKAQKEAEEMELKYSKPPSSEHQIQIISSILQINATDDNTSIPSDETMENLINRLVSLDHTSMYDELN